MTTRTQAHQYQLSPENSAITRSSGCTWCTLSVGANLASGVTRTPDQIHSLVKRSEESNPDTPGWSLIDASLAMSRLGVPWQNLSRMGWAAVQRAHRDGLYVVLQGDSDQFGNNTCSGAFDGDHCIGIRPENSGTRWLIDDPICPAPRWEEQSVIRRYAQKLSQTVNFGVFLDKVDTVWEAVIHPRPGDPDGKRPFLVYRVNDHDDRPLRIVGHDVTRTAGSTYRVRPPIKAVRGPGFPKDAYLPKGLCRLIDAVPHEAPGGYLDVALCKEV